MRVKTKVPSPFDLVVGGALNRSSLSLSLEDLVTEQVVISLSWNRQHICLAIRLVEWGSFHLSSNMQTPLTLMCLSTGIPMTINFPFGTFHCRCSNT